MQRFSRATKDDQLSIDCPKLSRNLTKCRTNGESSLTITSPARSKHLYYIKSGGKSKVERKRRKSAKRRKQNAPLRTSRTELRWKELRWKRASTDMTFGRIRNDQLRSSHVCESIVLITMKIDACIRKYGTLSKTKIHEKSSLKNVPTFTRTFGES